MQPVTQEELKELINEAKRAKKNVSELQSVAAETRKKGTAVSSGQRIEKKTREGKRVIESTGPAREEDFED